MAKFHAKNQVDLFFFKTKIESYKNSVFLVFRSHSYYVKPELQLYSPNESTFLACGIIKKAEVLGLAPRVYDCTSWQPKRGCSPRQE